MVILDYVILACLAVGLILGLWKGLFRQVFAIAGIFIIGLLTSVLSPYPDKWFAGVIKSNMVRHIVAIVLTLAVVAAIYGVIIRFLSKLINKIPIIGWLNRILGAVFSIAAVYMIFAVLIAIVLRVTGGFIVKWQPHFLKSWFVRHVYGGTDTGKNFFGNWLVNMFVNKIHALFS